MLIINMECFRKLLFEQIPGYTFLWGLMEDERVYYYRTLNYSADRVFNSMH